MSDESKGQQRDIEGYREYLRLLVQLQLGPGLHGKIHPSGVVQQTIRLSEALARLPDVQREALMLRHFHDWPSAEIAEHLGRTHAAATGLLEQGLQLLRNQLRDEE